VLALGKARVERATDRAKQQHEHTEEEKQETVGFGLASNPLPGAPYQNYKHTYLARKGREAVGFGLAPNLLL
jgi:hypothetical protein